MIPVQINLVDIITFSLSFYLSRGCRAFFCFVCNSLQYLPSLLVLTTVNAFFIHIGFQCNVFQISYLDSTWCSFVIPYLFVQRGGYASVHISPAQRLVHLLFLNYARARARWARTLLFSQTVHSFFCVPVFVLYFHAFNYIILILVWKLFSSFDYHCFYPVV